MSRLGGMGALGGVRISSNAMQAATMSGFIDKNVRENCDKALEKNAAELADNMKKMIITRQCRLAANTAFTQEMKGGNIPLVDSSSLVQGITWKRLDKGEADLGGGKTNNFAACFVGVLRNAKVSGGASQIGGYTPTYLVNLAARMVTGYTVTMPRTGVTKLVPARDFREKPYRENLEKFQEEMGNGVAFSLKTLGTL